MPVLPVESLRSTTAKILCIGSNPGIIQSILDFDYICGKAEPSIVGIIASGRKTERYFYGPVEITLSTYTQTERLPQTARDMVTLFLNLTSGRRVLSSSKDAMQKLPNLQGGIIFAEGVPERHAIELYSAATKRGVWLAGPASVGVVVPGVVKLGAIGGVQISQLEQSRLFTPGSVAVISSSGGMVNEVIRAVANSGHALSFSVALGGDRFPVLTPEEAFLAAQADPATKSIAYFGELGGTDEYVLVDLIRAGQVTKPVVAYIAGAVADLFDVPPQFGHAKALAQNRGETARAKAEALASVGVRVGQTFGDFIDSIEALPAKAKAGSASTNARTIAARKPALIASSLSGDREDDVYVLDTPLLQLANQDSFAKIAVSMLLGSRIKSAELEAFTDYVLRLLVDHGPYVSGAVNTIVAARAGKDLVSSLAAGLLTIGPRFGGAINQAAATWLGGVTRGISPADLVEELAAKKQYISGIGHRKYRIDLPDPRVAHLLAYSNDLPLKRFTAFALAVQSETVRKKGNLILNVDGAIAAILLDLLAEKEGYTDEQLQALVDSEFFNALFVLSRTVGFMGHYYDQVRLDEGIFRLSPSHVAHVNRDPGV